MGFWGLTALIAWIGLILFRCLLGRWPWEFRLPKFQKVNLIFYYMKVPIKYKTLEVDEKIIENFKEMFENMGDLISE